MVSFHHCLGEEYYQLEDRIEKEMDEWNSQMTSSRNPHCWEVTVFELYRCTGSNSATGVIL